MPTFSTRVNSSGIMFKIFEVDKGNTTLTTDKGQVTVNMGTKELLKCWHDWQMNEKFVGDAFKELRPDQIEFIVTGGYDNK